MHKPKTILLFTLLFSLLLLPAFGVQAQNDTQPLDDEFIDALVMMAVNHDLMEGKNELPYLQGLASYIDDYYDTRSLDIDPDDTDAQSRLNDLHQKHSDMIKKKISQAKAPAQWLLDTLDFFTDLKRITLWDPDPYVDPDEEDERWVEDDEDQPDDVQRLVNATLWTDFGATVNAFMNVHTISALPSLAPAINDSSGWSYNVPAITDSSVPVDPASGDDGGSPADFWGDGGGGGDSGPAEEILVHKPVRFVNNGFEAVTVVVESYEPASGLDQAIPAASTVVFPENSSSAALDLPQGVYTFCYYWQLDKDFNNDDYFDYHHRSTRVVTLNASSNDDVNNAVLVTLNPKSNVSNPNGKCGETPPPENGDLNLTPEEQANAGTHTYLLTASGFDGFFDGDSWTWPVTFTFSNGAVHVDSPDSEPATCKKIALNTYECTEDEGVVWTFIFRIDGMEEFNEEGKVSGVLQD